MMPQQPTVIKFCRKMHSHAARTPCMIHFLPFYRRAHVTWMGILSNCHMQEFPLGKEIIVHLAINIKLPSLKSNKILLVKMLGPWEERGGLS